MGSGRFAMFCMYACQTQTLTCANYVIPEGDDGRPEDVCTYYYLTSILRVTNKNLSLLTEFVNRKRL